MADLSRLVKFIELGHQFRKVERALANPGELRKENDVEHSFQLALAAWYIVTTENLDLDLDKILRYALLHDFVEIYAGDTNVYTKDLAYKASKHEREKAALERLRNEFPEFNDGFDTIAVYESRTDAEGRFVYSLDKILPALNVFLDDGKMWKENQITFTAFMKEKVGKVDVSPEIRKYFDEFLILLKEREKIVPLFHI